jgi:hypothetical protein
MVRQSGSEFGLAETVVVALRTVFITVVVVVAVTVAVAIVVAVAVKYSAATGLSGIVVFFALQQVRAAWFWPQQNVLVISQGVRATRPEGMTIVFRRVLTWHKGD